MSRPANTAFMSIGVIVGLLGLSPSFAPAERAAAPRVIKCEGPFGRNATRADVIKAFGANAVDERIRHDDPDSNLRATVLYPKDPKRRLEIIWEDQKARRTPTIKITGEERRRRRIIARV